MTGFRRGNGTWLVTAWQRGREIVESSLHR